MSRIKKAAFLLSFASLIPGQTALSSSNVSHPLSSPNTQKKKPSQKETGPFVNIGYFNVPVIRNENPVAYIGMQITLEGINPIAAEILRVNKPKIYSAFFIDLYILTDVLWGIDNAVNMNSLKKRFEQLCNKTLGMNLVKNLTFEGNYVRELK